MRTLAELQNMVTEYAEVAFPDAREIDAMSESQRQQGGNRMYALALHITDLIIEAGVHRGEVLK